MNTTNYKHIAAFGLIAMLVGLSGCHEDVDLNNVDTQMQAELGVTLPVGNMLFTANDFLGGGQVNKIYVDADGAFHYIDTIRFDNKNFHPIDLSKYVGQTTKVFKVKTQLANNGIIDASGYVKEDKKGSPITLNFPLSLQLGSINSNPSEERVDSVQVSNATLKSIVNVDNLGLQWSWINSVDVVLSDQFRRLAGKTVRLYTKGDGYGYGTEIPISVDQFTVSLMKDKSQDPGATNVVDTCGFTFIFNFTVPKGQSVQIHDNSAFNYQFATQFITFDAAWGYFQASNQMRDRDVLCIDSLWSDWKNMKKMKLRLMEPSVMLLATHHVAAPIIAYVDTIMAVNANERVSASWNGQTSTSFFLDDAVIDPYSDLSTSATNTHLFNHEADKGHLDQLFDIRPDTILYSYSIKINPNEQTYYKWKQHRVTSNTEFSGYGLVDIPFKLNKESEIEYVTKITDVNLSQYSIDSLLKGINGKAEHVKLYLKMINNLPFKVNAKVWFLRQDSTEIDLHLFEGQEQNEITLPAPKMEMLAGSKYGRISEPSESIIIVDVDHNEFDLLTQCKHLKIDAYVGSNIEPCVIDTATSIKAYVGLAGDVKAIINPKKK